MVNMSSFNPVDIITSIHWAEAECLEFKSARGGLPSSLWETYSAMANTNGGVIFLGVENDGSVSGVLDPTGIKKSFWDTLNNRGKVNINLLSNDDLREVTHFDKTLLVIRVPRASRYQRPVFIGQNPLLGTYRRNYEGDYRCTEQEVGRMLSDRAEQPADSSILLNFNLSDLDQKSLQQYRQRFASHKPTHPWLSEDDKGLLLKLGGWRKSRETSDEGITVAGLLMFGTNEALKEALPGYNVDYREKLSDDPSIRWTDRLTIDGTWTANLFQFYLHVIRRLSEDLKLPFQLDNLVRKGETVVHEAIREALVNALIHADYQGQGGIVVEKYKNRLEFSNPGSLLVSFDQLMTGNISECRNKSLQNMFMMMGISEKAGSGVDKILRGWQSQHWRIPSVSEQFKPDRVKWILPMISLIPDESLARLKRQFKNRFDKFNQLEIQALVTADLEGAVDNARMRQITNSHTTDITKTLQDLVGIGALIQEGQGRWTRYKLFKVCDSLNNDIDSAHNDIDSIHNGPDSVHNDFDSIHNDPDSIHRASQSALKEIAIAASTKKRLDPKIIEGIILQLCANRWFTRRELGSLLSRNEDGLRSRFLTPMVTHNLLQLRYPDKPNRVDQAYTSTKDPAV